MRYISLGVFPIILYFIIFCILTYPLISLFPTHLFADKGDGLIHVWNIWWINKAVTQLHQSPWQTSYLHYPHGISLLGHTLNSFNGFMGIVLLRFLTLIQTHNFIVIFSFVVGGLTAFWLAWYFTKSYWASFIAGAIFTFSNYHFAHAQGHLNLVSLEWIPLFVLCWYVFITRPGIFMAIVSAIVLFLVFLCDYYYFLYSILIGCLVVIWYAICKKDIFFLFRRKRLISLTVFIGIVLVTTGPLIISLLLLNISDPLWGSHPSGENCLDLLAPFIPGGHWRFAHLTEFYWSKLPGNIHESSVHMGISVFFVLIYGWIKRGKLRFQGLHLWYFVVIFFVVMSLGPVLQILGKQIQFIRLPYALLKKTFPDFKLSGFFIRTVVMLMLTGIVLFVFNYIRIRKQKSRTKGLWLWHLVFIFFAVIIFEAVLHICGTGILFLKLPYALFEKIFPPLRLSGCPVRMMVMVMLGASVISAFAFKMLFQKSAGRFLAALLLIMLFFEYLPKSMPASQMHAPGYVKVLKNLPADYGIIDMITGASVAAYYQTIHQKPMAFSDVSRLPRSVQNKDNKLRQLIHNKEYMKLYCDYKIRYLLTDAATEIEEGKMLYNDNGVKLYDLETK